MDTRNSTIAFRTVGPGFVAEVLGVDCNRPPVPAAPMLHSLYRHRVLVFRGQSLDPAA